MTKSNKIILVGGGGHCHSVIECIESLAEYKIHGIIDIKEKVGTEVLGYKVIGTDEDLAEIIKNGFGVLITLGHLGSDNLRKKYIKMLKELGGWSPKIIASSAHVSRYAQIGEGVVIHHGSFVNANCSIGDHSIINSSAVVEHDVSLGENTHIAPGAIVNGDVTIFENVFVGSGAVIKQGISVVANTTIGAGAFANKDIVEQGVYLGVPAKKKEK